MGGWHGSSQLWFCLPSPPAQTHKLGPLQCQVISTSKRSRISTINPQQSTRSHPTYIKLQPERTAGCHTRAFYVSTGLPWGVLLTVVGRPRAPREQCARARRELTTLHSPALLRARLASDLTEDQGSLRLGKGLEHSSVSGTQAFSALLEILSQLATRTCTHSKHWNTLFRSHGSHTHEPRRRVGRSGCHLLAAVDTHLFSSRPCASKHRQSPPEGQSPSGRAGTE